MRTLEQAIVWYDGLAKDAGVNGYKAAEEINSQLAAWLRELRERRKAPEIVRCGECKHRYFADNRVPKEQCYVCGYWDFDDPKEDGYCNFAERRTE